LPISFKIAVTNSGYTTENYYTVYSICLVICTVSMMCSGIVMGRVSAKIGLKNTFVINYLIWIGSMVLAIYLTTVLSFSGFNAALWFLF